MTQNWTVTDEQTDRQTNGALHSLVCGGAITSTREIAFHSNAVSYIKIIYLYRLLLSTD